MNIDWIERVRLLSSEMRNLRDGCHIAGCGDQCIDKRSPRDGAPRATFETGRWSGLTADRRSEILHRLADPVHENREHLALLEALDVGERSYRSAPRTTPAACARI